MHGRRIYHARGKVLGGSSSINGMIFQRGNPLDYERWAADPGMDELGLRALPAVLQAHGDLPGGRRRLPRRGRARWSSSAARPRSPLFEAFFEAVQQAGYPLTDDVNGYRQEGFARFDRNIHRGRRLSAARAYLHPVMSRPNLEVVLPGARRPDPVRRAAGPSASSTGRAGGARSGTPARAGERDPCCGGAINSPAAPAALGRRCGRRSCGRWDRRRRTTSPGWARTCRTTWRSTSSTPARQPVSMARPCKLAQPAVDRVPVAVLPPRVPARRTTSRPAASSAATTRSTYPNVMFHFLPIAIRYDGTAPGGGHGYQVHVGPMYSDARGSVRITTRPTRRAAGAALQLPVDGPGPPGVGRGGPCRADHPRPAGVRALRRRRALAGRGGGDRRGDPRLGGAGRRDRPPPVVHLRHGHRRRCPWSTRSRCACTASTGSASSTPRRCRYVTNGNIYAPVMMLAEKAADLIAGNTPLAPEHVPFYRHHPS